MRLIVGIALGFLAGYLYGSERARDEAARRLASAQEPVRRATERVSEVIASSPLPETVKQTASRATASIETATQQASRGSTDAQDAAGRAVDELSTRLSEPLSHVDPESPA